MAHIGSYFKALEDSVERLPAVEALLGNKLVEYGNVAGLREELNVICKDEGAEGLQELLLCILEDIPASVPYADWKNVMIVCANYDVPYEVFDEWCRLSPGKYNAKKNKEFWDNYCKNKVCTRATVATLLQLRKKYSTAAR